MSPYMKRKTILIRMALLAVVAATMLPNVRAASDADNSEKNVNDRSGETVTPENQSNAREDVDITAAIRSAVVKDSSLSTYAHNIKIITTDKHVVYLRGPVATADEGARVGEIAQKNSSGYPVRNQLSVAEK